MRITKSVLMFLAALLSVVPGLAQAADVAVFPVESTNLTPEDRSGIGELLAQSYAAVSRQAVLAPSHTQATLVASASHAEAAQRLVVSEYIRISAVSVGRRIVIHATRHAITGEVLHGAKMTAESIEDVTTVSDRMARALYERADEDAVRTHKNVTLTEARPKARIWTEKLMGIKTGVHMPVAKGADYDAHLSLQFDGRLEHERFFLEFGAGALIPTSADYGCDDYDYDDTCVNDNHGRMGGLFAEIGGSVFLTQGNVGLYVGGGLIPQLTFVNDFATASVYGQVGMTLPREASTRFYTDLRVAQNIIKTNLDNGWDRYPTTFSLHAGIGW